MTSLRRNCLFEIRDKDGVTIIKFGNIDQNPEDPLVGPSKENPVVNLRIMFDITDSIASNANMGDITVYNMNRELLTALQKETHLTGELLTSDGDEPLKRIYYGRIFNIIPTKNFPDYMSVFHLGEKLSSGATLNKTILGESKTIVSVIETLKTEMGIDAAIQWESPELKTKIEGFPLEFGQYVGHGYCKDQLDQLSREYQFIWNQNDNVLSIYDNAKYDTPVSTNFYEITPLNNIYGNPTIGGLLSTDLNMRIKLLPDLRAGNSVDIKNLEYNHFDWQIGNVNAVEFVGKDYKLDITGLWRMHLVKHFGDTRDNQWETVITCIQARGNNNGS